VVVESTPLAGTVKVRLDSAPEEAPRVFHRDQVTLLSRAKHGAADESAEAAPAAEAENTTAKDC
jgi:hypothetical protein